MASSSDASVDPQKKKNIQRMQLLVTFGVLVYSAFCIAVMARAPGLNFTPDLDIVPAIIILILLFLMAARLIYEEDWDLKRIQIVLFFVHIICHLIVAAYSETHLGHSGVFIANALAPLFTLAIQLNPPPVKYAYVFYVLSFVSVITALILALTRIRRAIEWVPLLLSALSVPGIAFLYHKRISAPKTKAN